MISDIIERMEKEMRIAVTYEEGKVFQHFGRTELFKIYDVEGMEIKKSDVYGSNGEAIYDNIANTWDVSYFYNKEQRINYTDVTTTQNYVVAVGTDPEHQYIMQGWKQTSGFLYNPLYPGQISVANDDVNESRLFVTHIQNNEFAVTYEYSENNGIGIKINTHKVNTTKF